MSDDTFRLRPFDADYILSSPQALVRILYFIDPTTEVQNLKTSLFNE